MSGSFDAIVVGAGLGGLSAAIYLQKAGHRTVLLEQGPAVGGKCNRMSWQGYHFDTGPSLLTLPRVLRRVFADAGRSVDDYLNIVPVSPACRYFYPDGVTFDAPGSIEGFRALIAEKFPSDSAGFDRFWNYCQALWNGSGELFLFNRLSPRLLAQISPARALQALAALRPATMDAVIRRHFKDPHLIQFFRRYATYNGSSPFLTPATFNVVPYVELEFGAWHVEGGMYAMVVALAKLAEELGVDVRTDAEVDEVVFSKDKRRVEGVALKDGTTLDAPRVAVNQDAAEAFMGDLLKRHPRYPAARRKLLRSDVSSSGFVVLMAHDGTLDDLACHNVYFCSNYEREFAQLFDRHQPLEDPTIYISAPSRIDPTMAPRNCEALFLLVNAPSLHKFDDWEEDAYKEHLLSLWKDRYNLHSAAESAPQVLERNVWTHAYGPRFLHKRFSAWHGSIYGPASNHWKAAFLRQPNKGSGVEGLGFCGGSAHPGGGIPLVLTSGRLAAEALS